MLGPPTGRISMHARALSGFQRQHCKRARVRSGFSKQKSQAAAPKINQRPKRFRARRPCRTQLPRSLTDIRANTWLRAADPSSPPLPHMMLKGTRSLRRPVERGASSHPNQPYAQSGSTPRRRLCSLPRPGFSLYSSRAVSLSYQSRVRLLYLCCQPIRDKPDD